IRNPQLNSGLPGSPNSVLRRAIGRKILSIKLFVNLWAASRRTSSAIASGLRLPPRPTSHESRGSGRPEDPSHGRRGSRRWSVPADCGRYRGCRLSLQSHWSDAHVQLCEGPNSASLVLTCILGCTRLVSADNPATQDYSSCTSVYFYPVGQAD